MSVGFVASPSSVNLAQPYGSAYPPQNASNGSSFMQPNSSVYSQQAQSQPYNSYAQAANTASNAGGLGASLTPAQANQVKAIVPPAVPNTPDASVRRDFFGLVNAFTLPPNAQAKGMSYYGQRLILSDILPQLTPNARNIFMSAIANGNADPNAFPQQIQQANGGRRLGPVTQFAMNLLVGIVPGSGGGPPPRGNLQYGGSPPTYGGGYGAYGMGQQYPSSVAVSA